MARQKSDTPGDRGFLNPQKLQRRIYAQSLAAGLSKEAAADAAGLSPQYNPATRKTREEVREFVERSLQSRGITMDLASDLLRKGMFAKQYQLDKLGNVHEFPDYFVAFKYIELVFKLLDAFPQKATDASSTAGVTVIRETPILVNPEGGFGAEES